MFRVAVLGYRVQGSKHHAPAFARLEDCRIAAVCDVVEERAREGGDLYGVPVYTDADAMLDNEEIDIVNIPVGERFRYDLVMNCLRRDKHVFTEKPLVAEEGQYRIKPSDVPKAREIVDEWLKHDVQFGECFCLHGSPNVRWAKEAVASGKLGELRQINARCSIGSWNHLIDLVRHIGGEVQQVCGYWDDHKTSPSRVACLLFESGAFATLSTDPKLTLQFQIKWIGEAGEITIDNIAGSASYRLHGSDEAFVWNDDLQIFKSTYETLFELHIEDFVASIRERRPFVADAWAGLRHMEIDAAITDSCCTGRPVSVERYMPDRGATLREPDAPGR